MADINKGKYWRKILWGVLLVMILGGASAYFIFTQEFEDTSGEKAAYTVNAMDLIKDFQENDSLANAKYAEQIMTVNGRISETEQVDSSINIKMIDSLTNAYIIFAFQDLTTAAALKEGDSVSIKGSCSGGAYSEILETESISFKRCVLNN
jgi:Tfp pilus assembly protein PilV